MLYDVVKRHVRPRTKGAKLTGPEMAEIALVAYMVLRLESLIRVANELRRSVENELWERAERRRLRLERQSQVSNDR